MSAESKTVVLVAGLGSIGARHARLLAERPDVRLWLCDPDEARRANAQREAPRHERVFADYEKALAEKPDAVFLATPNSLHVPMGLAAVQAGADVLVEKPISDSVEAAMRLKAEAERLGRMVQVGYMLRYLPLLEELVRRVQAGHIGQLCGGTAVVGAYRTLILARTPYRMNEPGALVHDYTHEFDYVRWLFGEAQSVSAMSARLGKPELLPAENIYLINLRMKSGALVHVHMDYLQHPQRRVLELYGDHGEMTADFDSGEIRAFPHGDTWRYEQQQNMPTMLLRDNLYRSQIDDFLRQRAGARQPRVTAADGVAATRTAEAAILAAKTRREVDL